MITSNDIILLTGASGFIGTNLVDLFIEKDYKFVNFDKAEPTRPEHNKYWVKGNIMSTEELDSVFNKYQPTIVIHLAAVTDTASDDINYYKENIEGSQNVLDTIKKYDCVKHCIMTSTQYVYKSLTIPYPTADDDYQPHTTYGISKMTMEKATRSAELKCGWTIVRPANVWGPWNLRYPNQLLKYLDKGLYFHPVKQPAVRTYAYVKNLTYQLDRIINSELDLINHQTYVLGDQPIDSAVWLQEWIKQLRNENMRYIPSWIMACGALFGDCLKKFGIAFPLYTVRYRNMMDDYYANTNKTVELFGVRNPSLSENVKETIDWLKGEGCSLFPYWQKKYGSN